MAETIIKDLVTVDGETFPNIKKGEVELGFAPKRTRVLHSYLEDTLNKISDREAVLETLDSIEDEVEYRKWSHEIAVLRTKVNAIKSVIWMDLLEAYPKILDPGKVSLRKGWMIVISPQSKEEGILAITEVVIAKPPSSSSSLQDSFGNN